MLLDDLTHYMGCMYVSDLKYLKGSERARLLHVLSTIPRRAYPEEEWGATYRYLHLPAN